MLCGERFYVSRWSERDPRHDSFSHLNGGGPRAAGRRPCKCIHLNPSEPCSGKSDRAALIMSASTTTFTQNERVLCYHGPMIYEAKILKIDNWDDSTTKSGAVGPHFFVHYKGWKQTRVSATPRLMMPGSDVLGSCRWDEWVPAARLLKYNETNLELAKTLKNASTASTSKSANKSACPNLMVSRCPSHLFCQRAAPEGDLVPGEPLPLDGKMAAEQREGAMRMIQTGDQT